MAYSTIADLTGRIPQTELIQLTDESGDEEVDTTAVAAAIADADGEIDGYLGSRYAVPLSVVPDIIRKYSVDIAIYNLYALKQDTIPEVRKERYENAVKFLTKVAEGKISLGADDPGGTPSDSGISWSGEDQVMTSDVLGRF